MPITAVSAEDLNQAVGASGELSLLDKRLLRMASARLTPAEMSEKLSAVLSPAECAQRVREILHAWDWLSLLEQRALILMDLIELKEILMDRVRQEGGVIEDKDGRTAYSFGDPRWATAVTKVLGEMSKLISSEQGSVDAERAGIRRAHAMVMVRATEMAFDRLSRSLRADYPALPERTMREALEEAVPVAIATIDAAVTEDDITDEAGGF